MRYVKALPIHLSQKMGKVRKKHHAKQRLGIPHFFEEFSPYLFSRTHYFEELSSSKRT
jgi:hypothetical protein